MSRHRRPLVAVLSMLALVVVQAIADPTGLLALVGWPGGALRFDLGLWPIASTLIFTPVLLAVVWWVAVRVGRRFWLLALGFALAVLVAQAVAVLAMTGDLSISGRAAAYVTAKAVPAALIVAALTRWLGGRADTASDAGGGADADAEAPAASGAAAGRSRPRGEWASAALFAGFTPLLAGEWWTGTLYADGIPVAQPDRGVLSVVVAVVLTFAGVLIALRWIRPRVHGVLGGWLAAVLGGAMVGVVQGVIGAVVDGGFRGDIWPLMLTYMTIADGLAFGACVGWILGALAALTDRLPVSSARATRLVTASLAVVAVVASTLLPGLGRPQVEATSIPAGFLRADGDRITDGKGNQLLLRGANVNQLVDFYQHRPDVAETTPLTETDFEGMATYGFNVMRLGISWSALEPTRGELDPGYLEQIHQAVDQAADNGIYTVLDVHQDGWYNGATRPGTTCRPGTDPMWGYDGAPGWATITDGAPRCQFTGRDISPAGDRAFQHFYFDTDGIRSALAVTWGRLAAEFHDEPMVAGFDLLNEPGFGETAPATTSHQLGEFYRDAIREIRAAGAPQIVFFEPSILWSGLGFDVGPQPGFTTDTNISFSPHLYAESITMDRDLGIPPIVSIERQFELAERAADAYDAPRWSGEYGYWGDDVLPRLERYAAEEDERMLGSAYWVWKQACGDPQNGIQDIGDGLMIENCETGEFDDTKADVLEILSRAYPRVAPGMLTSLQARGAALSMSGTVDDGTCDLQVWFPGGAEPAPQVTGITEVSLEQVDGGWVMSGCAAGDYSISAE